MNQALAGKTALITGASGGIGRAIAKTFHAAGAKVGLHGTKRAVLDELAAELGDGAYVLVADLSDLNAIDGLVSDAEKHMQKIDILVNNAGITRDGLMMRMKDEDWQAVIDVNLTAAFRLTRAVLRGMMKQRFGRIISISSVVGVTGNAGQANYAASKAGIIGMSKALAQEVASRNITVNCIAPGFIETAMTQGLDEKQQLALLGKIPAGRMGTADEIADAALFLAREQAGYITGETININGGMAMM